MKYFFYFWILIITKYGLSKNFIMSFFKKVFSNSAVKADEETLPAFDVALGRYTEINKTADQLSYWSRAQDDFLQKKYLDSFNNLLLYMNDPKVDNIKINRNGNELEFELEQGSKIVKGKANENSFMAESRIARFDKLSVAFLRKLMNMNFVLQYCRFAIKEDIIFLKFDSKTIDASPNKVYYSLRELALKSDKMDDLLTGEFESLHPIDIDHITEIPEDKKDVKYKYLQLWINETLNKISELDEGKLAGGISYMLLGLLFRIDYLLMPQGNLFDDIEKINGIYNLKDNKSILEKNRLMIEELRNLQSKSKEYVFKNFYETKATFGYVTATSHKQFYEFLLEEFKNTQWYYDNRYDQIITSIYEWMIGYSFYYYGLFPATHDFLKITYMVMYPDYFKEIGYNQSLYDTSNNTLNQAAIEKEIQRVITHYIKDFPKLAILTANLKYTSLNEFLYTYLNELTYLNFSKVWVP